MGYKITITQREGLRDLSEKTGRPITDLVEEALTRVLDGHTPLPQKCTGEKVHISVILSAEKEAALKALSKTTEVALDEICKVAVKDLLTNSQALIDKAQGLVQVQVEQTAKKGPARVVSASRGLAKTLQDRRAALMAEQEDDEESPRAYTRGLKKSRHN